MAKGETYEEFVDKFKPKLTTDDCYTPPELVTASRLAAYSQHGVDYAEDKAAYVRRLDSQKGRGKSIFGGGIPGPRRTCA